VDDATLFWVVLHLLVVFTEQLFATLVSSGGNRRLPLAALHNRDFVVWTGHFVSLLSVIRRWGGILPPHFGQKKAGDLFQISCSVCHFVSGGYLVVKVRGKLTRCERFNKESVSYCRILLAKIRGIVYSYDVPFSLSDNCIVIVSSLSLSSLGTA